MRTKKLLIGRLIATFLLLCNFAERAEATNLDVPAGHRVALTSTTSAYTYGDITVEGILDVGMGVTLNCNNITVNTGGQFVGSGYGGLGASTVTINNAGSFTIYGKMLLFDCNVTTGTTTSGVSSGEILVKRGGYFSLSTADNMTFNGKDIYVYPKSEFLINSSTVNMNGILQFISVESDYNFYNPDGGNPDPGALFDVTNSTISGPNAGTGYSITVAGGNGQKLDAGGTTSHTNSLYFSQQPILPGKLVYPAQAIFDHSTVTGMRFPIINWDLRGGYEFAPTGDPNGIFSNGGIIQASNCTFYDNLSVTYLKNYKNFIPIPTSEITYTAGNRYAYDKSFVRDCNFYTTTGWSFQNYVTVQTGISGYSVLGCHFDGLNGYINDGLIGIDGASLTMDRACDDPYVPGVISTGGCSSVSASLITNAFTGVTVHSGDGIVVQNTTFGGVLGMVGTGIFFENTSNSILLNNSLNINYYSGGPSSITGIALENSSDYWVEGNNINTSNSPTAGTNLLGIVINNSGANPNQVYRNVVNNMDYSMQANGVNKISSSSAGLKFLCNNLAANSKSSSFDITAGPIGAGSSSYGIASEQGVPSGTINLAAANVFPSTTKVSGFNVYNEDAAFTYHFKTTAEQPITNFGAVTVSSTTADQTCPNGTTCCSISDPLSLPPSGTLPYHLFIKRINVVSDSLNTDTPGVYNQYGICKYDVFLTNYAQLVDSGIRYFKNADSLHEFRGGISFQVKTIDSLYDSTAGRYLYDTTLTYNDSLVPNNNDSIELILSNTQYLYEYKMMLAGMYVNENRFADAYTVLSGISSSYTLSSSQLADVNNTMYLYGVMDSIYKKGSYDSLSAYDTTTVGLLARDSSGQSRYIARGILEQNGVTEFLPDVYIPTFGNKGGDNNHSISKAAAASISISPNPVSDMLNISLRNYSGDMKALIYDVSGKQVLEHALDANGSTSFSMASQPAGTYIVQIMSNNRLQEVHKIVKE